MNIQWYPGHMTKTKRIIQENISLVDIVIEVLDARIPLSSKNPDIDVLANNKKRIIVLNKSDLADDNISKEWKKFFENKGFTTILTNSISGKGIPDIYMESLKLMHEKIQRLKQRGRIFVPVRAMIVGIPNVGKSALINKCIGKKIAATGDRPGITRSKQWIKIKKEFELLDTPGILWPKFDDEEVGLNLAFTGAVKDEILDIQTLALKFIGRLLHLDIKPLLDRYKITFEEIDNGMNETNTCFLILEKIAEKRGFIQKGGVYDLDKASIILLDEFRALKLGKISLETPK